MSTRSRQRRDSGNSVGSAASEPAITRSRSTTPFTLRSQCTRHGSECPEGHGLSFRNRLSPSPRSSSKKSHRKVAIEKNGNIRKNLALNLEARFQLDQHESPKTPIALVTEKSNNQTSDYSSAEEEGARPTSDTPIFLSSTPLHTSLKTTPLKRYKLSLTLNFSSLLVCLTALTLLILFTLLSHTHTHIENFTS